MSATPKKSPWGKIQYCEELYPGVYDVSTASHGGIMVRNNIVNNILSQAAQKEGFKEKGFLNFEEDTQSAVAERELLDKGLWGGPPRFDNITDYEDMINDSLKLYNPEYWQAREKSINGIVLSEKTGKPSLIVQAKENQETIKNQNENHISTKQKKETVSL